ncbi:DUF3290 family protein [Vagococcus entomophilus]|uniref:DUF3290 domain-containing protein n=1 Tax=Vagococcus entomophilus TaxID=1160095 RepID=A0A430AIQ0_9ENTE|nr:DUF3290 family protein [Vagococcus entomophilus]RSU07864.1 hypothetical protein CBF30_01085 [Vagococcus entomophilus]
MTFYTYQYFQNQAQSNVYLKYGIILILLLALFFVVMKNFRNRVKTKYRDLTFILLLSIILLAGIQLNDYKLGRVNKDNNSKMLVFIDSASKNLEVNKKNIAINSTNLTDQMVIKIGERYYQVNFNTDYSSYNLEEAYIINDQINTKN